MKKMVLTMVLTWAAAGCKEDGGRLAEQAVQKDMELKAKNSGRIIYTPGSFASAEQDTLGKHGYKVIHHLTLRDTVDRTPSKIKGTYFVDDAGNVKSTKTEVED